MSYHPLNLALRFILEITALFVMGYWGWGTGTGIFRILLTVGVPVLAAALWGTFAVPDDPSRSGRAPVPVPGIIRLVLEWFFFGIASWMLLDLGERTLGLTLATIVFIHYAVSYERIRWLLSRSQ
jgi:hypothetical protein